MGNDTTKRTLLPIACTLGPTSSRERLGRWAELNDTFRIGSTRSAGEYVVHYRDTAAARTELADLVAGERDCCGFVDWAAEPVGGELQLRIRGTETALDGVTFVADAGR